MISQLVFRRTKNGYEVTGISKSLNEKLKQQLLKCCEAPQTGACPQIFGKAILPAGIAYLSIETDSRGERGSKAVHAFYVPGEEYSENRMFPIVQKAFRVPDQSELPEVLAQDVTMPELEARKDCQEAVKSLASGNESEIERFLRYLLELRKNVAERGFSGICVWVTPSVSPETIRLFMEGIIMCLPKETAGFVGYRTFWNVPEGNVVFPVFFSDERISIECIRERRYAGIDLRGKQTEGDDFENKNQGNLFQAANALARGDFVDAEKQLKKEYLVLMHEDEAERIRREQAQQHIQELQRAETDRLEREKQAKLERKAERQHKKCLRYIQEWLYEEQLTEKNAVRRVKDFCKGIDERNRFVYQMEATHAVLKQFAEPGPNPDTQMGCFRAALCFMENMKEELLVYRSTEECIAAVGEIAGMSRQFLKKGRLRRQNERNVFAYVRFQKDVWCVCRWQLLNDAFHRDSTSEERIRKDVNRMLRQLEITRGFCRTAEIRETERMIRFLVQGAYETGEKKGKLVPAFLMYQGMEMLLSNGKRKGRLQDFARFVCEETEENELTIDSDFRACFGTKNKRRAREKKAE